MAQLTYLNTNQIFFPRSIEGEIAAADAKKEKRRGRSHGFQTPDLDHAQQQAMEYNYQNHPQTASTGGDTYLLTSSPVKQANYDLGGVDGTSQDSRIYPPTDDKKWDEDLKGAEALPPLRPNRRRGEDVEMGGVGSVGLTETNLSMHNLHYRNVNPMVSNFTSPIGEFSPLSNHALFSSHFARLRLPGQRGCDGKQQQLQAHVHSQVKTIYSSCIPYTSSITPFFV
jgi:hypothetical protein